MKKLVLATMMCLASLATEAQVLTSQTINDIYEQLTTDGEKGFVYNADRNATDGRIAALYVYRRTDDTLTPLYQYRYDYDACGCLLTRTTLSWRRGDWRPEGRLSYQLLADSYSVEYSRWNRRHADFDQPVDKMTYMLHAGGQAGFVYSYHRRHAEAPYKLTMQVRVDDVPFGHDHLLTQHK